MPDLLTHAPPANRWHAFFRVLALSTGLVAIVACADRIVAPDTPADTVAAVAVTSTAVSDVVERLAPSLPATIHVAQLTSRFAELQAQMEAGSLSEAELTLALARKALRAAQAADDGAMEPDLAAIELALDDAGQVLGAAAAEGRKGRLR